MSKEKDLIQKKQFTFCYKMLKWIKLAENSLNNLSVFFIPDVLNQINFKLIKIYNKKILKSKYIPRDYCQRMFQ